MGFYELTCPRTLPGGAMARGEARGRGTARKPACLSVRHPDRLLGAASGLPPRLDREQRGARRRRSTGPRDCGPASRLQEQLPALRPHLLARGDRGAACVEERGHPALRGGGRTGVTRGLAGGPRRPPRAALGRPPLRRPRPTLRGAPIAAPQVEVHGPVGLGRPRFKRGRARCPALGPMRLAAPGQGSRRNR